MPQVQPEGRRCARSRPEFPSSTRRRGFGSILGKLSMAQRTARKMTKFDVMNMNSAAFRGAWTGIGSATCLWEGLAELPFVTRRCEEPRAGSSDKIPIG